MKRIATLLLLCLSLGAWAQNHPLHEGLFAVGDNPAWKQVSFDDSAWPAVNLTDTWDDQGYAVPGGLAWYRFHFTVPSGKKDELTLYGYVALDMGFVDDCDQSWLNGAMVGSTGEFADGPEGYKSAWQMRRRYLVPAKQIKWGADNLLAVRVYDGDAPGGFYESEIKLVKPRLDDFVSLSFVDDSRGNCSVRLLSQSNYTGTLKAGVTMIDKKETSEVINKKLKLKAGKPCDVALPCDGNGQRRFDVVFTDAATGEKLEAFYSPKYILTPPAPLSPRYNGPLVYGVRPGSPIIFRLPFSGERPMRFSVENLPEGATIDAAKGILGGKVLEKGDYSMTLVAENAHGTVRQQFTLKVGDKIALTPPMGWNSWNCWGTSVSQKKVMSSAQAIIDKGLADYGYSYINVDDAWESAERNPDGTIGTNEKFPDMKGLGDFLHGEGLKFGIYSSPGDRTCGGYLGSLDHERQDAETWNEWGVDYLKYDWCGYSKVFNASDDRSVAAYVRPYLKMQQYLREQPRDIFYSLCQYGMADVWTWGPYVDANSWRTTGDITDTWGSLYHIGFELQNGLHPYAAPGHWNDPDMLIVGKVGWSSFLRDSRLTPDEQYTHISLWSLLAANMLIGCDVAQMDDFTVNLLCNNEVNAVHQDILGVQARRTLVMGDVQVWSRPLADGGTAIGVFNLAEEPEDVNLGRIVDRLGLSGVIRDLWRQENLSGDALKCLIAPHGVRMIKVIPSASIPVMSYNIRYGTAEDGNNSWEMRREAAAAMICDQRPAAFGVQEALDFQLEYMQKNCPGYKYVGVGREDGVHDGEHMAVFYDSERVELENWGTYWLSETPDVPSFGWDAACKRTATWTLLKDKCTGKHFYFVNTHLDHVGKAARRNGLAVVVKRIGAMNPEGYPMILCGDFNVYPDDPCLTDLRGMMKDARETAPSTDWGLTWHDWGKVRRAKPIDFIFYDGFEGCRSFSRITQEYRGVPYVSDHYPVKAELVY